MWSQDALQVFREVANVRALRAALRCHGVADAPPPRRLVLFIEALRGDPTVALEVERAAADNGSGLAQALASLDPRTLSPQLLHGLAIYWTTVQAHCPRARVDDRAFALARSVGLWMALAASGDYLAAIAARVPGGAGDPSARARAFVLGRWEQVVAQALAGARERTLGGRAAMRVLGQAAELVAWVLPAHALGVTVIALAQRGRAEAEEVALGRLRDELAASASANEPLAKRANLAARGATIWFWSAGAQAGDAEAVARGSVDVAVEVLTEVERVAWEFRRSDGFSHIHALYTTVLPLVDFLAGKVRSGDGVAHAALVAQALELLATDGELPQQIRLCERALEVCPGHPNARSSLAHYLASQAIVWLREAPLAPAKREAVSALLARAEALRPTSKRLADARARARAVGVLP